MPSPDSLPILLDGAVVKGFGRGSKLLGIPTANLPVVPLQEKLQLLGTGIYYGWAKVEADPTIYKMVMSVGWNPFFQNKEKTVEPYLIAEFAEDFYGKHLSVLATGFIRPEQSFSSLDALKEAIWKDVDIAKEQLELPEQQALRSRLSTCP